MQVTVGTTKSLERHLTITVPAASIEGAVATELRNIAKNHRFNGFRKGKVPLKMVSRMYGSAVRNDMMSEVMQRYFIEAIIKEKVNLAGVPIFTPVDIEEGKDLVFKASFEIHPKISLKNLNKIEVVKPQVTVSDEDVAEMIETLRKQQASWADVDGVAEANSRVTIDFIGSIDDEGFRGDQAEGFVLVMGQGRMVSDFEDGIVGKKVGEKFMLEVNFPKDYHTETLKGRTAKFDIKLNKIETRTLPELTDEFVMHFGVQKGGLDGMKKEVRKNMERALIQAVKNNIKEQVIDGLVEQNKIDVPSVLIDQEVSVLRQQAIQSFDSKTENTPELPCELFEEQAKRRVVIGLLLGEVIESEALKVDENRVLALITDIASEYEDPTKVISYYEKDLYLMKNMRNIVLEEQAIDALLAKSQVSEKKQVFAKFMNHA
ncbi:trigger factor [Candidatus Enterovibrio altilux]|uniref:Trigger factor n=1 Tax=Candidatus Enterovibrio altilux TaxID=1927128 RepID=A0A291B7T6_9GAMM|nr:trigger factor [Candidatus Enterovibrio luxaltus]ATF09060.1 Cell division trigger factor [Candidatus Enterovibrio luxaltus]